jgi:integrase
MTAYLPGAVSLNPEMPVSLDAEMRRTAIARFLEHNPKYAAAMDYWKQTRALGKAAGLPYRVTAHILRHGFARLCKTREIPIEVAARLLGHNDITTTAKIYGRLAVYDLRTIYDKHIGEIGR